MNTPQTPQTFAVVMLASTSRDGACDDRIVRIPAKQFAEADVTGKCELAFYYGQNDVQPLRQCSVSVGDVIVLDEGFFMCLPCGFTKLDDSLFASEDNMFGSAGTRQQRMNFIESKRAEWIAGDRS